MYVISERAIDTRQRPMIKSLEQLTLKDEPIPLFPIRVDHLFESKKITFDTLVAHQVDSAETTLAEQVFYYITVSYNAPRRKNNLYLLHASPQKHASFHTS